MLALLTSIYYVPIFDIKAPKRLVTIAYKETKTYH